MGLPHASALLLLAVILLITTTEAAEWSKFKTCSQQSFCRRHRTYRAADDDAYIALRETVKVVAEGNGSVVVGHIRRMSEPEARLKFTLHAIDSGIFRASVASLIPELHTRYQVKDVISEDLKYLPITESNLKVQSDHALLIADENALKVTFSPFKIELLDSNDSNGAPLININEDARLKYELHREKPSPKPSPSPAPSPSPSPSEESGTIEDVHEEEDDDDDVKPEGLYSDGYEDDKNNNAEEEGWGESFQSHHDPQNRGPESIGADISFPFATVLHGIPERTVSISLPRTKLANDTVLSEPYRLFNLDVFEFELEKPLGLYGAIPLLIGRKAGKSAAVLWLNTAETYVDVLDRQQGGIRSHWFSESGHMDLYLMSGPSMNSVFDQYRLLTGPPAMPQRFALGYHQCRWNYRDDADVRSVDAGFEKHEIPYDVIWLDIEHTDGKRYFTWDYDRFPDPSKLQNDIAARGRKMVTIVDPHIKRDDKYAIHKFATDNNHYVMNEAGKPYEGWCWPGSASYFDFTSPTVRTAWASRFNPKHYPHFTENLYTWVDMNEPSVFNGPEGTMPKQMVHEGSVEHRHVHNIYGMYVQRATFEGLLEGHGGNHRPFVLSRSFFAGSQRYGAIWTGDNGASWEHLASTVHMLIPLQMSGMVFSGADVGGFFGNVEPELLQRWYQVGAFQPFFRAHGHLDTARREPWLFGDEVTQRIANAIRARYSYLPLWYTLFAGNALANVHPFALESRAPPMRPLWWEFHNDPRAEISDTQWLVGSSLLVAPVFEQGATSRSVYLPGGHMWYDLYHPMEPGRMVTGGQDLTIETPLDRMIVFHRGGSIIPKQNRRRRSSVAMATDPYTLVVALNADGEAFGELYTDDGKSYNYENGAFTLTKFLYAKDGLESIVSAGGDTNYVGWKNAIERIVIMGVENGSIHAMNIEGRNVEFEEDADIKTIIVRKPGVTIGSNWRLSIS